jgi:His/Glu/Gln/Arg/opine family amino acid ABC transporter permease subunit
MNVGSIATALANGLVLTLQIAALSFVFALILGLLVALCRMAQVRVVSGAAFGYVQLFRAISLYIYILWIYFGLPLAFGLRLTPLQAGVLALTLLDSAYMAEIYRSAIRAVDRGQWEAAVSLGMSRFSAFFSVVLPQALRIATPSLVNQLVDIIKDSSIVAVIGASDLMYTTIRLVSATNRPFELYTAAGAIYLAVVLVVSHLATRVERRQRRYVYAPEGTHV